MSVFSELRRNQFFLKILNSIQQWHNMLQVAFILVIAAALRLYNVASHRLIYADESLISYVAFAWMKFGTMPYRDIWAPQSYNPIMYVVYQFSYQIFGFNALAIRMVAVVPGIISTLLLYLIGLDLFGHKVGLVASFVYAIYIPYSVELEHSYGYNHSFVNMLGLAALYFLLRSINYEKKTRLDVSLIICGIFLFLAITIKPYVALIFLVALGIIAHTYSFNLRRLIKPYFILFATFFVAFSLLTLYLCINGAFEAWLYCFQHGRLFSISLGEKVTRFIGYISRTLFVMMFAFPVAIWGLTKREYKVLYPFFWSLLPTVSIISMGNFTDGTLFTTFAPLVLLSAVGITWLLNQTLSMIKVKNVKALLPVALLISSILVANAYTNFSYYVNFMYSVNPEVDAQISVGKAIADITHPNDKIFVTDTALAVLSQREVITVGPIKAAGFYNDLMGYDFERYIGIPGYPRGIINNDMILSALETEKPKVIVISRHDVFGMLDEIIWTGGQEQIYLPLGPYIMKNYVLYKVIEYDGKRWEIWLFSPGNYCPLEVFSNRGSITLKGNQSVQFALGIQKLNSNYTYCLSAGSFALSDNSQHLVVNYTFPNKNHAFVRPTIEFSDGVDLRGYKSISIWVKGDGSSNTLWVDLIDATGREYGISARSLNFFGWKNILVEIDKFAEQGIDISAIKQMRVSIDNNSNNIGSGTVVLAEWALLSYGA